MDIINSIFTGFMSIVTAANDFLWSWGVGIPIFLFGVVASLTLRFPWARMFKQMMRALKSKSSNEGATPFQTLCIALGGQVGTGNVVGVATALAAGGPGALFWMWVIALLGMTTMLVETTLGQLYKEAADDGTFRGGTAFYIRSGMKLKSLAIVMSVITCIGVGIVNAMSHVNSISQSVEEVLPIPPIFTGIVLVVIAGIIIFGGLKRLAHFSEVAVPFMTIGYLLLSVWVLVTNLTHIPAMISMVCQAAFNFEAAGGGVLGYTMQQAFRYGMSRGVFSNEAGQGTNNYITACASAKHPVTQGLLGSFAVAVDTLLVCSGTGLIILLSGVDYTTLSGAALTQSAFATFFGDVAPWIIAVVLFFFAFTSLLASFFGGRVSMGFLTSNKKIMLGYTIIQLVIALLASLITADEMFQIVDLTSGLMTLINVIAMIFLFRKAKDCIKDYENQLKAGIEDPVYDWNKFRKENGMEPFPESASASTVSSKKS